jgi:DNA-binding response OmpR family regulator
VREAIRLEGLPVDVHVASDGEAAIRFIAAADNDPAAPCPDLLLLDINLPKSDGFEVLRRLHASAKCREAPVLMITSSDSPTDRGQAAGLGAGYFQKPESYDEFMKLGSVLRKMLRDLGWN